jgi:hypothetical protein
VVFVFKKASAEQKLADISQMDKALVNLHKATQASNEPQDQRAAKVSTSSPASSQAKEMDKV